jgi:hypothetical protein
MLRFPCPNSVQLRIEKKTIYLTCRNDIRINKISRVALKAFVYKNELFYMDKTMMVFGDAKKVIEDMVKAVE